VRLNGVLALAGSTLVVWLLTRGEGDPPAVEYGIHVFISASLSRLGTL
jgi:hypothetical protein